MGVSVRSFEQGDISVLNERFQSFSLEPEEDYCVEITDTKWSLLQRLPFGQWMQIQSHTIPHIIGAGCFRLKQRTPTLSQSVLVILSRDLQLNLYAVHRHLLCAVTLLSIDLLTEPTIRETMLEGSAFGCEFSKTPINRSIKCNVMEVIEYEETDERPPIVRVVIEVLPSLYVFLSFRLDSMKADHSTVIPDLLTALAAETLIRRDSVASSITSSSSEDDGEIAEMLQTCECMRNDETHSHRSATTQNLKPAFFTVKRQHTANLIHLIAEESYLFDIAPRLTDGNLFNSKRIKRSSSVQVAHWTVSKRDEASSFDLRIIIQPGAQLFANGPVQSPSELVTYRITTGLSSSVMGVSRVSNLPWNAHTIVSFQVDPLGSANTPMNQDGQSTMAAPSPLQKRLWVLSTSCIYLLSEKSAGDEDFVYVFSGALWHLTLSPVLRSPPPRTAHEDLEAYTAAEAQWFSLTEIYCGEQIDFKSRQGKASGRRYHFYPTRGHLLLGSEVITLTPHTFMVNTELESGTQGHPIVLVFDPVNPISLLRAVGGDELRPTLMTEDEFSRPHLGNVVVDPTMLDDLMTTLDPGFRTDSSASPVPSETEQLSSFVESLEECLHVEPIQRVLAIPSDFTAEQETRIALMTNDHESPPSTDLYICHELTDSSTRLRSANLSRVHETVPFTIADTLNLSGVCSNWVCEIPIGTDLPYSYLIILSSESMDAVPIGRTEIFGLRSSDELSTLGEELSHDTFPWMDFENYTIHASLIECEKGEWTTDLAQITPNEIRVINLRSPLEEPSVATFYDPDDIGDENMLLAVCADVSGPFVSIIFEDQSVRVWEYVRSDTNRLVEVPYTGLGNVISASLSSRFMVTLELVETEQLAGLPSIIKGCTLHHFAELDDPIRCILIRALPSSDVVHCYPLLLKNTAPLVLRDLKAWKSEMQTIPFVDDLKRRSLEDLMKLSTVMEGQLLEASSNCIVSANLLDTPGCLTLALFEQGKSDPLIYTGQGTCLIRQKVNCAFPQNHDNSIYLQDDVDESTIILKGTIRRIPAGCIADMRPSELYIVCQPTSARRQPMFLSHDMRNGWSSYSLSFIGHENSMISGLSYLSGTSVKTSGLIVTSLNGCISLARLSPIDPLLMAVGSPSAFRLRQGLIEESSSIIPDLQHHHVIKASILNTNHHKALGLLLNEHVKDPESEFEIHTVKKSKIIVFSNNSEMEVPTQDGEVATCLTTFVVRDQPLIAVGLSRQTAPKGKLLVGIIGPEPQFFSQGVPSAVMSVGQFNPNMAEVSTHDFIWYTGGSRLFIQEIEIGASVSVSGGSFCEADHVIMEVKPVKHFLILATVGGCEFAAFRLLPIKVQTNFVPFKIARLASSFLHRNFNFVTTTCACLVQQAHLAIITGDPFGNCHVSVYKGGSSSALTCSDTIRLSATSIIQVVSKAVDVGNVNVLYLTGGGEIGMITMTDKKTNLPKSDGPIGALKEDVDGK